MLPIHSPSFVVPSARVFASLFLHFTSLLIHNHNSTAIFTASIIENMKTITSLHRTGTVMQFKPSRFVLSHRDDDVHFFVPYAKKSDLKISSSSHRIGGDFKQTTPDSITTLNGATRNYRHCFEQSFIGTSVKFS